MSIVLPGIYLCSMKHRFSGYGKDIILYNDIVERYEPDICCDALSIDFENQYSFVIATPPCNFYSKANWRRYESEDSLNTKHILPDILRRLVDFNKKYFLPFIVENVCNDVLLPKEFDNYCYRFTFGGHTFWTNVIFDYSDLIPVKQNKQYVATTKRNGNYNVHCILERFLETILSDKKDFKCICNYHNIIRFQSSFWYE